MGVVYSFCREDGKKNRPSVNPSRLSVLPAITPWAVPALFLLYPDIRLTRVLTFAPYGK